MNAGSMRQPSPALLVATVALVVTIVFAAPAAAGGSFSDPSGDNTAALDIRSATVSESADKRLTVSVAIDNVHTLPPASRVDLWFDLDNDLRTGDDGDEALARYLANGTLSFFRWNGSDLVRRSSAGMTASFDEGILTYAGPKSAFDDVASFGLLVVTRGVQEFDDEEVAAYDAIPALARLQFVAPGPTTFGDPEGDVPVALDLTAVKVSDASDGTIRFSVAIPSGSPPPGTIQLAIDRDLLGRGSPSDRAEVLLRYSNGKLALERWGPVEEEWVGDEPPIRARVATTRAAIIFEVHRSELDDVARFGLTVESWQEDEDENLVARDLAPDDLAWTYTLAYRPPLRLLAGEVYGAPERPVAGRPFAIHLPVRRSDTSRGLTRGTVTCKVIADGRSVRARGSLRAGLATCTALVPRNAMAIRGSMTVRSAGESITAWFAGAIDFGGGVDARRATSASPGGK